MSQLIDGSLEKKAWSIFVEHLLVCDERAHTFKSGYQHGKSSLSCVVDGSLKKRDVCRKHCDQIFE